MPKNLLPKKLTLKNYKKNLSSKNQPLKFAKKLIPKKIDFKKLGKNLSKKKSTLKNWEKIYRKKNQPLRISNGDGTYPGKPVMRRVARCPLM